MYEYVVWAAWWGEAEVGFKLPALSPAGIPVSLQSKTYTVQRFSTNTFVYVFQEKIEYTLSKV